MSRFLSIASPLALFIAAILPMPVAAAPSCAPSVTPLARGFGSPDDVAVSGNRVLFGDMGNGSLAAERAGRVSILALHLSDPEGIVVESRGRVMVAEQGANQITELDLTAHRRRVLFRLQNSTGRLGVDGITPAPGGGVYIPDSPHGTLLLLDRTGAVHQIASGMGRPVGAVRWQGGIAVADETDNAVWLVREGRLTRLATLSVPDDLAIVNGHLLADALGDGTVWEVAPHQRLLVRGFRDPQGMATLGRGSVVLADSKQNTLFRISGLSGCLVSP